MRNNKLTKIIANELQAMRTKARFTQEQMAHILKVARTTVANYEQGKRDIPADIFIEFCDACGVDPFATLDRLSKKAK